MRGHSDRLPLYRKTSLSDRRCKLYLHRTCTVVFLVSSVVRIRQIPVKFKIMMFAWNSHVRVADYGGMVQPSQQHVAPCVKGVEQGLGTKGLRIVAAFWARFFNLDCKCYIEGFVPDL